MALAAAYDGPRTSSKLAAGIVTGYTLLPLDRPSSEQKQGEVVYLRAPGSPRKQKLGLVEAGAFRHAGYDTRHGQGKISGRKAIATVVLKR